MFKFNKNEELIATIEKQKEQLSRYEARLRDVVHAYKSLQNEKQALENSMKALTSVAPTQSAEKTSKATDSDEEESAQAENCDEANEISENSKSQDSKEEANANLQHLRSQVVTLTQSLSTMSDEKSKIVAAYQAEKKKMKQEQEIWFKELQDEKEVVSKKATMLEEELTRVREKIRNQQAEREQEQATHSIMLREIQKMLNDERKKNESHEIVIKELRNAAQHAAQEAQQGEDYKRRICQLEDELDKVRKRLQVAEREANTPPPLLFQLQEEMTNMKLEHKLQLEKEHARVAEMEQRERDTAHAEEERVADLENRLVQISNKMGMYDGKRQKDEISIQHLKDRIAQLDIENTLLSKQLETAKTDKDLLTENFGKLKLEEDLDIEGLKERIMGYQQLLKEAANKSNEPIDLSDMLKSFQADTDDYQKLYFDSQQELLQLKEEFERYKTRAQSVLKNMKGGRSNSGSGGGNRELEETKRQVQEMRERHFHLRARCDDLEAKCAQLATNHEKDLEKQAYIHQTETSNLNELHMRQMTEKDRDIRTQRERTVAMLADKDKEIKQMKAYMSTCHSEYQFGNQHPGEVDTQTRHLSTDDATEESVSEILNKGSANDKNIIHYVEQLARKDVTINSIRRHKKQLELQIRQLQDASITKDEKYAQELAVLKEKLMENERGMLRENANMEYLKNVFFRYLTTADYTAKQRMLVALVTILQFSPQECGKVGVKR